MKYLKLFESFYYGVKEFSHVVSEDKSKKWVEALLNEWGVELEDLEDLFIWFSDFGYEVQIKVQKIYGAFSTREQISITIENIKDLDDKELMEETRKIIKGLPKIGLYCESPESYESIMLFSITPA